MFGSTPKDNPSPQTKEESVIARGLSLTGEITGSGIVRLDGKFEGSISCNELIIGKDGELEGTVQADTVLIHGQLSGEIRATSVTLSKTARVTGNVYHEVLEVKAGATIEGHYSRTKPEKADISARLVAHNGAKSQGASRKPALHVADQKQDTGPVTTSAQPAE